MEPVARHPHAPDVGFDGGALDCGGGLLLLIRRHIDPLEAGGLLEIRSTESSVVEDLPAWCRLTGNELVSWVRQGGESSFLVSKGPYDARRAAGGAVAATQVHGLAPSAVVHPGTLPSPGPAPAVPALAVMGVGSWPRPPWMLRAVHAHLSGRLGDEEFAVTGDDAVRLAVRAQLAAGVDVVTDGEQRRDSYAGFVGGLLQNVQSIPLTDLASMVEHADDFERELRALDVPAAEVRHPVVYGRLGRDRPLAVHEFTFVRTLTAAPVKVALPGPYLLTRTMWLDCLRENPYASREELSLDVVRVLREELHDLLAAGVSIVQFDEPVLTEVVFSGARSRRSFMCGALSERGDAATELTFARGLLDAVVAGLPRERTALHVCRGNWTRDETALLAGDYRPLAAYLDAVRVGTVFLEFSTPRAGELEVLADLDRTKRIGVGVVNPRSDRIETVAEIRARVERAALLFGAERVLLCSDCGFATFADNPLASSDVAAAKLRAMAQASRELRGDGDRDATDTTNERE